MAHKLDFRHKKYDMHIPFGLQVRQFGLLHDIDLSHGTSLLFGSISELVKII